MGFFDRLAGRSSRQPESRPPPPASHGAPTPTPAPDESPAGKLLPQLAAARQKLEQRDLEGAKAIYESVLAIAGDRPDVLVTISGDLGSCGYLEPIIELIAPRYDAERHGPATGLNLLQAYLALRNPEAAQHVLDVLFALKRPDLEERLWGFSNAIAELIETRRRSGPTAAGAVQVNLVTISKPIWSYGIETLPGLLPPKEGPRRRVGFAQLSIAGRRPADPQQPSPEDALDRFSRGFPLWLAETLYFSEQYEAAAALGLMGQVCYARFPAEWTAENIRQLTETGGKFDFVMTGALREQSGDYALVLRLWEIKTFRERKSFEIRWTPATADAVLAKVHEHLRTFFEWKPAAGIAYAVPSSPTEWIDSLACSLSTFLIDKQILPKDQLAQPWPTLANAQSTEAAALAHLTLTARAQRLALAEPPSEGLYSSLIVEQAAQALAQQ